jgi:hypothetical protein
MMNRIISLGESFPTFAKTVVTSIEKGKEYSKLSLDQQL